MAWGLWLIELHGAPVGKWLESYDPDTHDAHTGSTYPTGTVTATSDPAQAKRFPDAGAALAEWRRVSALRPTRPDGKPNRPLAAYTASPRRLPD